MSNYRSPLKARVIGEIMRGQITVEQAVETYGVSRTSVFRWLAAARARLSSFDQAAVSSTDGEISPAALAAAARPVRTTLPGDDSISLDELVAGFGKVPEDDEGADAVGQDGAAGGQDGTAGGQDGAAGGQDGTAGGQDGAAGSQDGTAGAQDGTAGGPNSDGFSQGSQQPQAADEQDGADEGLALFDEAALIAGATSAVAAMQFGMQTGARSTIVEGREYLSFNGGPQISLVKFISSAALAAHFGWEDRRAANIARRFNCSVQQLRTTWYILEAEGAVSASHYQRQRQQLFESVSACEHHADELAMANEHITLLNRTVSVLKEHFGIAENESMRMSSASRRRIIAAIQEFNRSGLSIGKICALLGLNVRSYYRWLKQVTENPEEHEDDEHSSKSRAGRRRRDQGSAASEGSDTSGTSDDCDPEVRPARRCPSIYTELETVRRALYSELYAGAPTLTVFRGLRDAGIISVSQRSFYNIVKRIHQLEASGQLPPPPDLPYAGNGSQGTEPGNANTTDLLAAASVSTGDATAEGQADGQASLDNASTSGAADAISATAPENQDISPHSAPSDSQDHRPDQASAAAAEASAASGVGSAEAAQTHPHMAEHVSDGDNCAPEPQSAYDEEGIPMMQPFSLDDLDED